MNGTSKTPWPIEAAKRLERKKAKSLRRVEKALSS